MVIFTRFVNIDDESPNNTVNYSITHSYYVIVNSALISVTLRNVLNVLNVFNVLNVNSIVVHLRVKYTRFNCGTLLLNRM